MTVARTRTAVYPGTFDPITNGHLDLIDRAAPLFERSTRVLAQLSQAQELEFQSVDRVGSDVRILARLRGRDAF